ncbi:MAG TPA: histidine phosphatase family protein, partial [Elusimicrobiota bacterium]|nr:histidine phosphatase family protein [Elusimicrobiota bacterium]
MDLLMMRHAEACGLGGDIQSDRDRTLTDRGIEQMESIFSQLSDKRAVIDAIVCSPYVRCVQTAVHLGQRFGLAEVYPNPILAPFGGVPDIGPILDQFLKKSLLLV